MKPRLAILVVCGLTVLAARKSRADDLDDEYAKLQGEWNSISYEAARTEKDSRKLTLIFKDKKVTMKIEGKVKQSDCDLNVETEPKQLDIVAREGTYVVSENKGIYKISGNTLTICHGGAIRPEKFDVRTVDYSIDTLIVLKRKR